MSKNLIYTVAVDHPTSSFKNSNYSKYSLLTWQAWCKKNDIDFLVIDKHDERFKFPMWNKYCIFDIVGDKYDKLALVDSDTMIKWNAPSPFELYDNEFCGVIDRGSLRWIMNSLNAYGIFYDETVKVDLDSYINSGGIYFTKEHKFIFDNLIELYEENKDKIDEIKGVGKDQTLLNLELVKTNATKKYLPPIWNLFAIHKKNMFKHNWQLNTDSTPFFIKYAYVWHFTGFAIESRTDVMKQVWDKFGHLYE